MSGNTIEVGQQAPAFTLKNQDDAKISLSALKGRWVVLYFYPKDDTPGCTVEACEFTSILKDFDTLDASVFGVSADSTERHRNFREKHGLEVELLSDESKAMMTKYGAFGEKKLYGKISQGIIRSTVIIDPAGKIAHRWASVKTKGHAEKVRDKLRDLAG